MGSVQYGRADGVNLVTSGKVSLGAARTVHDPIWVPSGNRARRAPRFGPAILRTALTRFHAVQHTIIDPSPRRQKGGTSAFGKSDRCRHGSRTRTVCVKVHTTQSTPSTLVLVTITFLRIGRQPCLNPKVLQYNTQPGPSTLVRTGRIRMPVSLFLYFFFVSFSISIVIISSTTDTSTVILFHQSGLNGNPL